MVMYFEIFPAVQMTALIMQMTKAIRKAWNISRLKTYAESSPSTMLSTMAAENRIFPRFFLSKGFGCGFREGVAGCCGGCGEGVGLEELSGLLKLIPFFTYEAQDR